jgi:hypothetical protein
VVATEVTEGKADIQETSTGLLVNKEDVEEVTQDRVVVVFVLLIAVILVLPMEPMVQQVQWV